MILYCGTMEGKIALEEHFVTPELEDVIGAVGWDPEEWKKVIARLEDTDGAAAGGDGPAGDRRSRCSRSGPTASRG